MISSSSFNFQSVTFPLANRTFHSVYLNVRQGETLVACIVESISMAFNLAAHCSLTFHGLLLKSNGEQTTLFDRKLGRKMPTICMCSVKLSRIDGDGKSCEHSRGRRDFLSNVWENCIGFEWRRWSCRYQKSDPLTFRTIMNKISVKWVFHLCFQLVYWCMC